MRLRNKLSLALESVQAADAYDEEPVSYNSENEVTEDLDELGEIATKVDSLESLIVTLESIGTLSPAQTALTNVAFNQIMVNTDRQGISLESESFLSNAKDNVAAFIERAKKILKDLWRKLQDFLTNLFSFIPMRISALEKLKARLSDASDGRRSVPASKSLQTALASTDKPLNAGDLKDAVKTLVDESGFYLHNYLPGLRQVCKGVVGKIDLEESAKAALPHYVSVNKRFAITLQNGDGTGIGNPMPGGYRVEAYTKDIEHGAGGQDFIESEAVAAAHFTVFKTRLRVKHTPPQNIVEDYTVDLTKADLISLVSDAIALLKSFTTEKQRYKAFLTDIDQRGNSWLINLLGKSASDDSNKFHTRNRISRTMMALTSLADWAKEPIGGLLTTTLRFSSSVSTLSKDWLSQTESDEIGVTTNSVLTPA